MGCGCKNPPPSFDPKQSDRALDSLDKSDKIFIGVLVGLAGLVLIGVAIWYSRKKASRDYEEKYKADEPKSMERYTTSLDPKQFY